MRVRLRTKYFPQTWLFEQVEECEKWVPQENGVYCQAPCQILYWTELTANFPELTKYLTLNFTLYFVNWILTLLTSFLRFLKIKSYSQPGKHFFSCNCWLTKTWFSRCSSIIDYNLSILTNLGCATPCTTSVDQLMREMNWLCEIYIPFKWKYEITLYTTWTELNLKFQFNSSLIKLNSNALNEIQIELNSSWIQV